ncbi:MAG: DUF4129 domain-containing protein [Gammaproteobacteria bacterium]|nr:DUF4129 domain-containing protein [Gammaproteobacteria bacterium]
MSTQPDQEKDTRPVVSAVRKDASQAKATIEAVKQGELFQSTEEVTRWRFDFDLDDNRQDEQADLGFIVEFFQFIALLVEMALWLVPIVVLYLLYRYREHWLHLLTGEKIRNDADDLPDVVFGLDIRQQELPEDIETAAMQAWQAGQYRQAVSLLYRGALSTLFHQYQLELPPGATEQDCIQQVRRIRPGALADHFAELTEIWTIAAYAHRKPDAEIFNQLCQHWRQHYGVIE